LTELSLRRCVIASSHEKSTFIGSRQSLPQFRRLKNLQINRNTTLRKVHHEKFRRYQRGGREAQAEANLPRRATRQVPRTEHALSVSSVVRYVLTSSSGGSFHLTLPNPRFPTARSTRRRKPLPPPRLIAMRGANGNDALSRSKHFSSGKAKSRRSRSTASVLRENRNSA
jgi:hypothetical protein